MTRFHTPFISRIVRDPHMTDSESNHQRDAVNHRSKGYAMTAPLTDDRLAALKAFDTSTIASGIETFGVRLDNEGFMTGNVQCRFPMAGPMVGYAVTAKIRCSSPPMEGHSFVNRSQWWDYILSIPAPRIVVIQDIDENGPGTGALVGEVHAAILKALGCEGLVTDGAVRDINRMPFDRGGFQLYSGSVSPSQAYAHIVEIACDVTIGGLQIHSGSLLHGDRHGIVLIPKAIAASLPLAAERVRASERKLVEMCHSSDFSVAKIKDAFNGIHAEATLPVGAHHP